MYFVCNGLEKWTEQGNIHLHVVFKKLFKGNPRNTVLWIYSRSFTDNLISVRIGVLINIIRCLNSVIQKDNAYDDTAGTILR
jgi:hypothetical protein